MSEGQVIKMQPYLKGINRNCRLKLDYKKKKMLTLGVKQAIEFMFEKNADMRAEVELEMDKTSQRATARIQMKSRSGLHVSNGDG